MAFQSWLKSKFAIRMQCQTTAVFYGSMKSTTFQVNRKIGYILRKLHEPVFVSSVVANHNPCRSEMEDSYSSTNGQSFTRERGIDWGRCLRHFLSIFVPMQHAKPRDRELAYLFNDTQQDLYTMSN